MKRLLPLPSWSIPCTGSKETSTVSSTGNRLMFVFMLLTQLVRFVDFIGSRINIRCVSTYFCLQKLELACKLPADAWIVFVLLEAENNALLQI